MSTQLIDMLLGLLLCVAVWLPLHAYFSTKRFNALRWQDNADND